MRRVALIGDGPYVEVIIKGLKEEVFFVRLIVDKGSDREIEMAPVDELFRIDLRSDEALKNLSFLDGELLIVITQNIKEDLFLTLTLRSLYPNHKIYSVSTNDKEARKLKMAGANEVIDMYHVSTHRIENLLHKPIATGLLDTFLSQNSPIEFREIEVEEGSRLDGVKLSEVDLSSFDLLLLGLIDRELGEHFTFITTGYDHQIDADDMLVCIGKKEALDQFTEMYTKRRVV